jgi:hypothetical protein
VNIGIGEEAMDDDELRECYGDEYPDAVTHDGVRMPLLRVDRFARHYYSVEASSGAVVSRFADGTAAMTFEQFKSEWPTWSLSERAQFCNECRWLRDQDDIPDMLRMIMARDSERTGNHSKSATDSGEDPDLLCVGRR